MHACVIHRVVENKARCHEPHTHVVLIADAGRARVFETSGKGTGLRVVESMEFDAELPPSRDIGADRPGRDFESVGKTRHAVENPSDPHRQRKRQFARLLADALHEGHVAGRYGGLVIVAPAVSMGDLRAVLSDRVKAAIKGDLVADLTKTPFIELPGHLAGVVTL